MLTLRRRISREDVSALSSGDRPVLLATLDVPFAEEAIAFAVDSAVESGKPLVVVENSDPANNRKLSIEVKATIAK